MSDTRNRTSVRREAFAEVIRREIARRPALRDAGFCRNAPSPLRGLPDEIAASGLMNSDTATRRLYSILNPEYTNSRNSKRITQEWVELDTADKILTALGLTHLWHTDLAEHLVVAVCKACGEPMDVGNDECYAHRQRESNRRYKAREKSAAASSRQGLGSLPTAPQGSGTASGGTHLEREAA